MFCSVLQCVAMCCSVLQCVAVYCSVLQGIVVCCSVLQCVAVCSSVLQRVAVEADDARVIVQIYKWALQNMQHAVTHCNTKHTSSHQNMQSSRWEGPALHCVRCSLCCRVLQCVAGRCSVLHCVIQCVLQCVVVCVVVCCSVMQCVVVCVVVCCSVL